MLVPTPLAAQGHRSLTVKEWLANRTVKFVGPTNKNIKLSVSNSRNSQVSKRSGAESRDINDDMTSPDTETTALNTLLGRNTMLVQVDNRSQGGQEAQ